MNRLKSGGQSTNWAQSYRYAFQPGERHV
jgi:hypothetical protein